MVTVPLVSADTGLYQKLSGLMGSRPQDGAVPRLFPDFASLRKAMGPDGPEVVFIDFSDDPPLADALNNGLFSRDSAVIALCRENRTLERINAIRDADILVALAFDDLEPQLPGILDLIRDGRPLLSRGIPTGRDDCTAAGSLKLRNSLFEAACAMNLIGHHLFLTDKLLPERRDLFLLPLYEMLKNAIEHGNCGISFDEKSRFLERGGCASDLIRQKCADPAVASKTVSLSYALHPTCARFVIADQGRGFDWRTVMRALPRRDPLRLHGRGILITRRIARSFRYNQAGNEAAIEIGYEAAAGGRTPPLRA